MEHVTYDGQHHHGKNKHKHANKDYDNSRLALGRYDHGAPHQDVDLPTMCCCVIQ